MAGSAKAPEDYEIEGDSQQHIAAIWKLRCVGKWQIKEPE